MKLGVALRLGRVSNLPTVWTNTLAGIVLTGMAVNDARTVPILLAMSLFYVGGMYLNDAFDAEIDAEERAERPIPSGQISRQSVFVSGFAMLAAGLAILLWVGTGFGASTGLWPAAGGIALAAAIITYDWHHKANPLSPLIMGLCRMLVYITAGLCFLVPVPLAVWLGAFALLCYLIGLTYTAKQENIGHVKNAWPLLFLAVPALAGLFFVTDHPANLVIWLIFAGWIGYCLRLVARRGPGDIPRAVGGMIAGIALLDGVLIAAMGQTETVIVCVAGFALTLAFQRFIPGT